MKAHITFCYSTEVPPNRVADLALCVACLRAQGCLPQVHTNFLPRFLKEEELVFTAMPTAADKPWTVRKFRTYAAAPDGEPYLHVDSDVFLTTPLPQWLLRAPIFVQTDNEPEEWYAGIRDLPPEWKQDHMPAPWRAMNVGVFGGDPALVRGYAEMALKGAPACAKLARGHVISEQAVLGRFVQDRGVRVASLMSTLNDPPQGYWHLMSKKDEPEVRAEVERRLWKLDPDAAMTLGLRSQPENFYIGLPEKITASTVRKFYKDRKPRRGQQIHRLDPAGVTITTEVFGLGDCVALSDIERTARQQGTAAWTSCVSPHWHALMKHCPGHQDRKHPWSYDLLHGVWQYGLGNGHIIQRAQRLCGLHVHPVPRGFILPAGGKVNRVPGRVCLHFEPSQGWASEQRLKVHPRARALYPATKEALFSTLLSLSKHQSMIEVGSARHLNYPWIEDGTGVPLEQTIRLMAECEFFIGIDSGPMHLATALGLKVVCIINFPHPDRVMLPVLVSSGIGDEWLYPQNVHLHQDVSTSLHMPQATGPNLIAALQGEVYPYWRTDVASELEEEIQ